MCSLVDMILYDRERHIMSEHLACLGQVIPKTLGLVLPVQTKEKATSSDPPDSDTAHPYHDTA